MSNYEVRDCSGNEWVENINNLPNTHFLQSVDWANIKGLVGWTPFYKIWLDIKGEIVAGAMILEREISFLNSPLRFRIQYIPKGPLLDWNNFELAEKVVTDIEIFSRIRKAIFLKIDPDLIMAEGVEGDINFVLNQNAEYIKNMLIFRQWKYSENQIQFQNTVWLNIEDDEEVILSRMKQKTRYNIRLAERKGIKIRIAKIYEYPMLYKMYAQTAVRDKFTIRSEDYYLNLWRNFTEKNICDCLIAEFEGDPIAGLILYYFGDRAFYVYGMSLDKYRNLMPTYLLQWEAIKLAKAKQKKIYDLWGAPYTFDESDSLWGVYKFKEGLGGKVIQTLGAWDFPTNKMLYTIYLRIIPKLLEILRYFGNKTTKQSID